MNEVITFNNIDFIEQNNKASFYSIVSHLIYPFNAMSCNFYSADVAVDKNNFPVNPYPVTSDVKTPLRTTV